MNLASMAPLGDVDPIEAEIGGHRHANQQGQDSETNKELYNLAMQSRGGQGLNHLLDIRLEESQQRRDEEGENLKSCRGERSGQ